MNRTNYEGKRFSRLVVNTYAGSKNGRALWNCVCDCGKELICIGHSLQRGSRRSCGCLKAEKRKTHGMSGSREYNVWGLMIDRCFNKKSKAYKNYGGRGIIVCDRWRKFQNFFNDMGQIPIRMTVERINNELGYSPDNCEWATKKKQSRNTRRNVSVIRISKNGSEKRYPVMEDVVDDGFCSSHVCACLKGRLKTHGGYRWIKG